MNLQFPCFSFDFPASSYIFCFSNTVIITGLVATMMNLLLVVTRSCWPLSFQSPLFSSTELLNKSYEKLHIVLLFYPRSIKIPPSSYHIYCRKASLLWQYIVRQETKWHSEEWRTQILFLRRRAQMCTCVWALNKGFTRFLKGSAGHQVTKCAQVMVS
jgi:hypothetical protein